MQDKRELEKSIYQGKLQSDAMLEFTNYRVTLEAGVEYVIVIVKKAD